MSGTLFGSNLNNYMLLSLQLWQRQGDIADEGCLLLPSLTVLSPDVIKFYQQYE